VHRLRIYAAAWLATAAAVSSPSAFAATKSSVAPSSIARAADQMLAAIDPAGPGAVVAITTDGKTIYAGARGLASVELGVPLTVDSVFRIGSITKSFTAAAILALADQHRVVLDAPIAQWLPDFPRAKDITIQQLLSHTAGVSDGWEAPLTEDIDTAKRLALIGSKPLDFQPGTDWHYSNSGYMLLGAVLEKVTGRAWYDAVTDLVIKPADLRSTGFYGDEAIITRRAEGYSRDAAGATTRPTFYSITGPGAAGALVSTASDVAQFIRVLARGVLLRKETVAHMFTPTTLGEATVPYGWGVMTGTLRGQSITEHNGMIDGYAAHYVYVPARDIAVVVLENDDAPTLQARSLAHRMAALALGKPYSTLADQPWSSQRLSALVGTYAFGNAGSDVSLHELTVEQGRLYISRDAGTKRLLRTAADDTLYYDGDGIDVFKVITDSHGNVTALDFHAEGEQPARRETRIRTAH
jgi:D-alanyl-D-alanine carboxypeptidase